MAHRNFGYQARDPSPVEGRERDHVVMRAQAPGWAELGAGRGNEQQPRLRARSASARKSSRDVGSAQCRSSNASTIGCDRAPAEPRRSSPPFVCGATPWRRDGRAAGRERDLDERREQGRVFCRVEADQAQRAFEIGEALFGRRVRAKTLPAPFGDRVQRRVLQELRGAPLDPGVRRFVKARVELLDEPRLAEPRFANNQHELALAGQSALPAARERWPTPPRGRRTGSAPALRPCGRRRSRGRS